MSITHETTIPATPRVNHQKAQRAEQHRRRIDRLRARRRSREWEVRLSHEFIQTWAHILHPQSFLLFTCLEIFADWRPGPTHGHTRGLQTWADLQALTGQDRNSVRRSIRELEFYGLIEFSLADPEARENSGCAIDIVVIQRTEAPKVMYRQQFQELNRLVSDVGAPTWMRSAPGSQVRSAPGSQGLTAPGTQVQRAPGLNTIPTYSVEEPFSSASSSGSKTDPPKTTTASHSTTQEAEDLFKLLPEWFDLSATQQLITSCRQLHPDCTTQEILQFVAFKLPLIESTKIHNPVGFLLTAVPEAMRGFALTGYRSSVQAANLRAAERDQELENWKCSLDDFKPSNGNGHNGHGV